MFSSLGRGNDGELFAQFSNFKLNVTLEIPTVFRFIRIKNRKKKKISSLCQYSIDFLLDGQKIS